jgi:hypothetical protein
MADETRADAQTDAPPKNSFQDLAGRRWLLKLNYGLAERIKDALGVDLSNAHDGQAFIKLGRDPKLLIPDAGNAGRRSAEGGRGRSRAAC